MFNQIFDLAADGNAGQLALVMLPGARMHARDFREHGFVAALRQRRLPVDVIMVEVDADDYVPAAFGQILKRTVLDPLRARGYPRIWLAGISLGAYGAMRLLQEGKEEIEGMLLLSPFLSTRGTIARVRHAGGLDRWSPLSAERGCDDTGLLCWLKDNLAIGRPQPRIYLGWGMQDRYADTGELLAARLPPERIFRVRGDHNWPTWNLLWHDMLNAMPFFAFEHDSRTCCVSPCTGS